MRRMTGESCGNELDPALVELERRRLLVVLVRVFVIRLVEPLSYQLLYYTSWLLSF